MSKLWSRKNVLNIGQFYKPHFFLDSPSTSKRILFYSLCQNMFYSSTYVYFNLSSFFELSSYPYRANIRNQRIKRKIYKRFESIGWNFKWGNRANYLYKYPINFQRIHNQVLIPNSNLSNFIHLPLSTSVYQ